MLLCFVDPILGNLTVRGHSFSQGTWGCRILTLHLNYVAGYTGPLLFLFERTHNYSIDDQGLVPWRLRRVGSVCVLLCFVDPILGNLTVRGHSLSDMTQGTGILRVQAPIGLLKK